MKPIADYYIDEQLTLNLKPQTYTLNSHFSPKPINPHVRKFSNTSHLVTTLN